MAKKSKSKKIFGKVLSVVLCVAMLVTTYGGFFGGFKAMAATLDSTTLAAGEVGLAKDAVQDGRGADITVQTAAKPVNITETSTETIECVLDVIMIIDTSGSMGQSYGNLIVDAKAAAIDLADTVYGMNSKNRVAIGNFAQYAYALNKSGSKIEHMNIDNTASGYETYFFSSSEQSSLNSRINSLSAVGGTNTEGGFLVAKNLAEAAAAADPERQTLVIFLTDGLPTGRYKDNGTKVNTVATYDGSGNGIPNYQELTEMVSVASELSTINNTQTALIFYTGGLDTDNSITSYYKGCTSASCRCNTANSNHGKTSITRSPSSYASAEVKAMSAFYGLSDYEAADHIVNDLVAPYCAAGIYMPEDADEMLKAFKDIINTYVQNLKFDAATDAVYTDIIPEYYDIDESSIQVSMGSAQVLYDQSVTIDGVVCTRDVIEWTIGTIPETVQTLTYSLDVNDDKIYGILDVAEQGILTYTECPYTVTHSPLVVQIDEIILAPKGIDDYYVAKQGVTLNANNNGTAGVKVNDDSLNTLIDASGNNADSASIVNGQIAGLDGELGALNLEGYDTTLVEGTKYGTVVLNEDGTFTYTPNSNLYEQPLVDFVYDANGTNEYNYCGTTGWEDTFTYRLTTGAKPGNVSTVIPVNTTEIGLIVLNNMDQYDADCFGVAVIGGNLNVTTGTWTVASQTSGDAYGLIVGGTISGNVNVQNGSTASNEQWIRDYAAKLGTEYTALSAKYASMAADGTTLRNQYYTPSVELIASTSHVAGTPHVFYVDDSTIAEIKLTGDFGTDPIIINMAGTTHNLSNGQYPILDNSDLTTDAAKNQIIWNFYEATSITTSSLSFNGSVLAPKATYTGTNGHINGSAVVYNMVGNGGFEYHMDGDALTDSSSDITVSIPGEGTAGSIDDYYITANDAVTDVAEGLSSEIITAHIRIVPNLSDLTATKTADPASGTVKAGDVINYTIDVYNPCGVAVENVVVNDSAPFGTTISNANGGVVDGRNISFTIDKIAAGGSAKVTFAVTVNADMTGSGNLSNTASINYTLPGTSDPTTVVTNTVNHAYLSAVKTSDIAADAIVNTGDVINYTITVTNNGSADAADVVIEDVLSDYVTFKSGDVTVDGNKISKTIGTIPAGQSYAVTFSVTVNEIPVGTTEITNAAAINGVTTNTVVVTAKSGSVRVDYVDTEGNKLLDSDSSTGKTGTQYGPYPAKDIENYRLVSTTGSATGTYTDGEIVIVYVYEKIPGSATIYYVDENGNTISDPQSVTGWQGDELTDLLKKDINRYEFVRTDADTTILTESGITIVHVYKLIPDETLPTINKTNSPASGTLVKAGDTIVYTITVTNNKYEEMTNVVVKDTAPKGTTILDANGGTVNGSEIIFTIPSIAAGATATVSFSVSVNANIEGENNLSNTATVIYRDREATADTEIPTNTTGNAILTAVKTGGTDSFYGVGETYTYYIKVTNNGSAAAQNIVVKDTVPAGTTLFDARNASVNGSELSWNIAKLEAGASTTVSFDVTVSDIGSFVNTITNTATVNDIPTNTTENTVKKGTVDVHFVDENGNALASSLHYEGKPGTAHGTTDAIDIYGWALKGTNGTTEGNFIEGNITITHVYYRLTGNAVIRYIDKTSGQDILPQVERSGYVGDVLDSDEWTEITNYTYLNTDKPETLELIDGTIYITHWYSYIKADETELDFVKTANPASGETLTNGQKVTYTITLKNTRVDAVNNVVITDYVPDGMSLASYSQGAVVEGTKITWNIGTIEVGGSAVVSFVAIVNNDLTGSGNLKNVATAEYSNRDLEPENPIHTNEVVHPIIDAKLESYTNQPDANLTEGDTITYKITITNEGSAPAYDIPVTALIPEGTTFVSSPDGTASGNTFVGNNIPVLNPGETVEYTYTVSIDTLPEYTKDFPNVATVDDKNTNSVEDTAYVGILIVKYLDHDGTELTATTTTRARVGTTYGALPILDFANREFDKVDGARLGSYIQGTIEVVFWYKLIPATLTVKYVDESTGEEIKPIDTYDGYYVGNDIPADYANEYPIDGYIYKEVVTPDPMTFDDTSEIIIHYYERILDTDAPTVTKSSTPDSGSTVKAGDTITYTITVTNTRATDALEQTTVTDKVPAGTTLVSVDNNGTVANGVIIWNLGSIPAGESVTVKFTVSVNDEQSGMGNLGNIADVQYRDVQTGEDKEVPSNSTGHAILVSEKTSSVAEGTVLYEGDIVKYTVSVTNVGTAAAENVVIYDIVPDGTAIIESSIPSGVAYSNGKLTYNVKSLAAGETKTLTFSVQLTALADGEYEKTISNTAYVNGIPTETVDIPVKAGTVTIKYQDVAGNELAEDVVLKGPAGETFTLPAEKAFDKLRLKEVLVDNNSTTFIVGNITYIYVYERIPATAVVKYVDYNTGATLLDTKNFSAYVGDVLESEYYEDITHYNFKYTDRPTSLEYTEDGLVIVHYYEYVYDTATLDRVKTASPASGSIVNVGDTITYSIVVTNPRYDAINNVVITDAVPAGTTFVSADNNGTESNGTVTWNLGTVAANSTVVVNFVVTVNSTFEGSNNLKNTAFVEFTGAGDTESTTLPTNDTFHAVLTSNKTVSSVATSPNNELTYTITVKNEGSTKAENVVVTDTVPANTSIVIGSYGTAQYFNNTLTWNIASLEAGAEKTFSFKVTIDSMDTNEFRQVISNKAQVNGVETNEVETVVTQGAVIVTHVADDGTVLKPEETVLGAVGETYSFEEVQSDVYELKTIEGDAEGTFVEGTKYVKFIYTKRDAGLVIKYLEYGTNTPLHDTYTESGIKVGTEITDTHPVDIVAYELVSTTYKPDDSLVMTKDGIEIIYYYKLIPTGSAVAHYVDEQGNPIADDETREGNIYETYNFVSKDIKGYELVTINGNESGNFPNSSTDEVTYVYKRTNGTLVVRYLEEGTNEMLADNVTEVYNTYDVVTNLHEKDIPKYELTSKILPSDMTMTEEGLEIIYYYRLIPTGTATAHYVDEDGNKLLNDIVKAGNIYETFSFTEQTIDGWHLISKQGAESGNFQGNQNLEMTYVYARDEGVLTVRYLEEGTNNVLSQTYNEVMHTGETVTDLHERTIDKYELVSKSIPESLVMTKDGIEIVYYYKLIPTGSAVAHFVDTEGNPIADDITAEGNIYETYTFAPIDVPGYKLVETTGTESGNFPANSTNEVVYTYQRCEGVLTVNYLEKDTGVILAKQYTETMYTGIEVTDLHYQPIAYYVLVEKDIPDDLVMTEAGIVITYYYSTASTGSVTANYVDEEGNPLLVPNTVNGVVETPYEFAPEVIEGYELVKTEGNPTGTITEDPQEIIFVYKKLQGTLVIRYLEKDTNEVLADSYTETLNVGDTVNDLRVKTISGYVRTSTEKPESMVMTTEGIEVTHFYTKIPTGTVTVKYVDEDGNELVQGDTVTDFVNTEYDYDDVEIPGYELVEVKGEPEGVITEEDQEINFIYKRLEGTLVIHYVDKTTGENVADVYTEVVNVLDKVTDLKETEIDGYELVDKDIPEDLTMTTNGLDVTYYYTPDTYTVSGGVWLDTNDNSTYNKGVDTDLSNIVVTLYDVNGKVIGTDTTDAKGEYSISGVKAGSYTVSFEVPNKYSVVSALDYSKDQMNSIADYAGSTKTFTVSGDTDKIGMGLKGIVLGSSVTDEDDAESTTKQPPVYNKTETKQENVTYTKVLGEANTSPATGDSDTLNVVAVMLVATSLFVLTLVRKKSSSAPGRR